MEIWVVLMKVTVMRGISYLERDPTVKLQYEYSGAVIRGVVELTRP
jgi:hypothetical protein